MTVLLLVVLACGALALSSPMDPLVVSAALNHSVAAWRAQRVAHGLSPEVLPHFTKVRMRDGVELWTAYWDPHLGRKKVPTVLVRSPYGILGTQNMALLYVAYGFAVVEQNQRGTGDSGGPQWCFWMTSMNDARDTLDWITAQPFSNGQVFELGASADGMVTVQAMKEPQPAMAAQFLWITTATPYATMFQNSQALRLALAQDWLGVLQSWRPKVPRGAYFALAEHEEGFNATYIPPGFQCDVTVFSWDRITMFDADYANVNFPSLFFGGWYDIFLDPQIDFFFKYDTLSTGAAVGSQQIIIDALGHCFLDATQNLLFPGNERGYAWAYEYSVELFLNRSTSRPFSHVRSPVALGLSPKLLKWTLYVMGPVDPLLDRASVVGNYWTTMAALPTPTATQYFLWPDNSLRSQPTAGNFYASYIYDPANPTPTAGGNNLFLACGPRNQTENDRRADNVVFDSAPFTSPTALLGSIRVQLQVSTNCTDTDFVVRVSDVYPGGFTSRLLTDNVVRMRWRNSNVVRTPTVPGQQYTITLDMWRLCYIFNAGHTLRVAVTSSNYPRYSANPNNGNLIIQGGPVLVASNVIYFGSQSWVTLPVVSLSQLPPNVE